MEINDAIVIAQGLKNHYRAFEKIEQLLRAVATAGNLQDELNAENETLKVQNSELHKAYEALKLEVASLAKDRDGFNKNAEARKKELKNELEKQIEDGKKKLADDLADSKKDLEKFKEEAAAKKEELAIELEKAQEKITEAHEQYEAAKDQIEQLKNSLS